MTDMEIEFNQLINDTDSPSIGYWVNLLGFLEQYHIELSTKQIATLCDRSEELREYFNTERTEQTTIRKNGIDVNNTVIIRGLDISPGDVSVICNLKSKLSM